MSSKITPLIKPQLYYKKFFIRTDAYGSYIQIQNGKKSQGKTVKSPLPENTNPCLNCIGTHTSYKGKSSYLCVDIDASKSAKENFLLGDNSQLEKEKKELKKQILNLFFFLEDNDIPSLIEDSTGGWHLWIFLENCKQKVAYSFGQLLKERFNLDEVFPKQASLDENGYGNWVRIPGIYHSKDAQGRKFYSLIDMGNELLDIRNDKAKTRIIEFPRVSEGTLLSVLEKENKGSNTAPIFAPTPTLAPAPSPTPTVFKPNPIPEIKNYVIPLEIREDYDDPPLTNQEFINITLEELSKSWSCDTYDDFYRFCMAFKSVGLKYDQVDYLFQSGSGYNYKENKKIYDSIKNIRQITFGTAVYPVIDKIKERVKKIAQEKRKKETRKRRKTTGNIKKISIETGKPTQKKGKDPKLTVQLVESLLDSYNLSFNEITRLIYLDSKPIDNLEINRIAYEIVSLWENQNNSKVGFIKGIIPKKALSNKVNPLLEWYNKLPNWTPKNENYIGLLAGCVEGDPYIERKLQIILGQHLSKWLNGGQARVPVFCGDQGAGKSFFVRWLCPLKDYFTETSLRPTNKDDMILASRYLMAELGELGSITKKSDQEALKSFLTRKEFIVRAPYGKQEEVFPHRCCWWGTANKEGGVLFDSTGHRRFIVIQVNHIDWKYTSISLEGIWAQAKYIYQNNLHYITPQDKQEIDSSNESESVVDPIYEYLDLRYEITDNSNDFMRVTKILDYLKEHGINVTTGTSRRINAYFAQFPQVQKTRKFKSRERGYTCVREKLNIDKK